MKGHWISQEISFSNSRGKGRILVKKWQPSPALKVCLFSPPPPQIGLQFRAQSGLDQSQSGLGQARAWGRGRSDLFRIESASSCQSLVYDSPIHWGPIMVSTKGPWCSIPVGKRNGVAPSPLRSPCWVEIQFGALGWGSYRRGGFGKEMSIKTENKDSGNMIV